MPREFGRGAGLLGPRRFAAVASSILLAASGAAAQTPVQRIDGAPTCGECVIERYLVATIHDETGSVVRQVGAVGEGPGEFLAPRFVLETSSAFAVLDGRQLRLTLLDKETLEATRTVRMPVRPATSYPVMFDDGTYVLSEGSPAVGAAPLHVVGPDGDLLRTFGSWHEGAWPQFLAPSGDRAFWAAYARGYRLERWSRDGELLQVLERAPEWWAPRPEELEPGDMYTFVSQIHEDDEGLLWVHVQVVTRKEERGGFFDDPAGKTSIIEVIDPRRAEVVASTRFPDVAQIGRGHGFLQTVIEETSNGLQLLKIWGNRRRGHPNGDS